MSHFATVLHSRISWYRDAKSIHEHFNGEGSKEILRREQNKLMEVLDSSRRFV